MIQEHQPLYMYKLFGSMQCGYMSLLPHYFIPQLKRSAFQGRLIDRCNTGWNLFKSAEIQCQLLSPFEGLWFSFKRLILWEELLCTEGATTFFIVLESSISAKTAPVFWQDGILNFCKNFHLFSFYFFFHIDKTTKYLHWENLC